MNPNELRELAERVDVAESTGDWDSCELSAAYLREQADQMERAEPVAWIEGPHGALRANPDYRFQGPQTVAWSFPLYLHPAPQSVPAGWSAPGPVDSDHPLECLIVLPALRQSDGDWWVSGDHFYAQDTPLAWLPDTNGSRAMIAAPAPADADYWHRIADERAAEIVRLMSAPADAVESLRELIALKKMKIAEISDFELYSDRYAKAWQNAKAALAAADQKGETV